MSKIVSLKQKNNQHNGCLACFLPALSGGIWLACIICAFELPTKTDFAVNKILQGNIGMHISIPAYPPPEHPSHYQHIASSDEELTLVETSSNDDAYTNSETSNDWKHFIKEAGDFISENPEAVMQVIQGGIYLFGDYKPGGGGHMQHYNHEGKYDRKRGSMIEQLLL